MACLRPITTTSPAGSNGNPAKIGYDMATGLGTPVANTLVADLASFIWTGGGADNNWTTAANWVDDVTPVTGSRLLFAGATRTSPYNNFPTGTTFDSITFDNGGFTLSGNSVTLSPQNSVAITNVAGQNQIDLPITVGSTGTMVVDAGTLQLGLDAQSPVLSGAGAEILARQARIRLRRRHCPIDSAP